MSTDPNNPGTAAAPAEEQGFDPANMHAHRPGAFSGLLEAQGYSPAETLAHRTAALAPEGGYIRRSLRQLRTAAWPTLKYLTETEVHTYAFSVAACAILSFIPAIVLMATIIRLVFHSRPMLNVIFFVVERYLPTLNYDDKMFVMRNFKAMVFERHSIQIMSLIMLLISSTGVFEPLEVALNKIWKFTTNRSYLKNQLVSLGLAFGCGILALLSVAGTTTAQTMATAAIPGNMRITILHRIFTGIAWLVTLVVMKIFALLATIAMFFLIYWLLPNGKVKPSRVFPAAVVTGVLLELSRYVYMVILPLLDFHDAYGPFYISITLIFWAFTAGMLLLGGAHLSAFIADDSADLQP